MAANCEPNILGIFTCGDKLFARFVAMFSQREIFGDDFGVTGAELIVHELAKFA